MPISPINVPQPLPDFIKLTVTEQQLLFFVFENIFHVCVCEIPFKGPTVIALPSFVSFYFCKIKSATLLILDQTASNQDYRSQNLA